MRRGNNDDFTDEELDGVIYEPSTARDRQEASLSSDRGIVKSNRLSRRQGVREGERKRVLKAKHHKSQYGMFYGITLITGFVTFVAAFAIMFNMFSPSTSNAQVQAPPTPPPLTTRQEVGLSTETGDAGRVVGNVEMPAIVDEKVEILAIIRMKDRDNQILNLFDFRENRSYSMVVNGRTELRNRSGQAMTFDELNVGDVVAAEFDPNSDELQVLKLSNEVWEKRLVRGAEINLINREVKVGVEEFVYENNVITIMDGENYDIAEIHPVDLLNFRGYGERILFIEVAKGHGTIQVINAEKIQNAFIEINTEIATAISEQDTFSVLEGAHRVVIRGNNIEPLLREVTVGRGEKLVIDLVDEVQTRVGHLRVHVNVADYDLYINAKKENEAEPIMLDFGRYTIRIEKDGYEPHEMEVVIDGVTNEIVVILRKIVKMHKIKVDSMPTGARVYINSAFRGEAPMEVDLEEGVHTITVKKDGYDETQLPLEVSETSHKVYTVQLRPTTIQVEQPVMQEPVMQQEPMVQQ